MEPESETPSPMVGDLVAFVADPDFQMTVTGRCYHSNDKSVTVDLQNATVVDGCRVVVSAARVPASKVRVLASAANGERADLDNEAKTGTERMLKRCRQNLDAIKARWRTGN